MVCTAVTTVVVLGGGLAGLLAGSVLAQYAEHVLVVEGDRYPDGPSPRRGLPQAHHSHVLVTAGCRAIEALLPGVPEALLARGAHRVGLPDGTLMLAAEGWFRRHPTEAYLISCSRGLLDHAVRTRVLDTGGVQVWERTQVLGLAGDSTRVSGVLVRRQDTLEEVEVGADLVVDATGRRSRAARWLSEIGARVPAEVVVDSGVAYATRIYQAPPNLASEIPAVILHPRPAYGRPGQGATLFPIEDGRWIVTLTGTRGGEPPTSGDGFVRFARSLRHPIIAELMAVAEPLGGVRPYRDTSNRRRQFERASLPEGFFAIGDAVAAVNPIYSHGMSVAALSALRLADELGHHQVETSLSHRLQAAMVEEVETSWRMAVAQDGRAVAVQTERARERSEFERRMTVRAARAVLNNPVVASRFFCEQALIAPSSAADTFSVLHEMSAGIDEPLLTADEAIAQFPTLAKWWHSSR